MYIFVLRNISRVLLTVVQFLNMMLATEGKAMFSDLNFEVVDKDVPTTSMVPKAVPQKPVNLDLKK